MCREYALDTVQWKKKRIYVCRPKTNYWSGFSTAEINRISNVQMCVYLNNQLMSVLSFDILFWNWKKKSYDQIRSTRILNILIAWRPIIYNSRRRNSWYKRILIFWNIFRSVEIASMRISLCCLNQRCEPTHAYCTHNMIDDKPINTTNSN